MKDKGIQQGVLIKILILLVLIPVGFYTKVYKGPLQEWINYSLCDSLYEIFWCLFFSLLFTKIRIVWIALSVFLTTSVLEFLQLWHPPFLQAIRNTFLGRTLIGNYFTWSDFFYYAAGCIASYFLVRLIDRNSSVHHSGV